MASTSLFFLRLLFAVFLLPAGSFTAAHKLRPPNIDLKAVSPHFSDDSRPTTFFEVRRPIQTPPTPPCSTLLLSHDFGYTYGEPPVTAAYHRPACLAGQGRAISLAVLEWSATCRGRQYDRIFGVWLGGVELLRGCTAEPRRTGIIWTVQKDVTRYAALLAGDAQLAVNLDNIVDSTYTGVYHVNITLHLYLQSGHSAAVLVPPKEAAADAILPISRSLPLNDGLWFPITNSSEIQSKQVSIPPNTYRAILEVFVSFHGDDEFWYTNPPDSYIALNNLTGVPGHGPFREVTVHIDSHVVGAVWPFTVVYTGGINPLLWRPITGIGSFDLPSYDIDVTPYLGWLLDGGKQPHEIGFGVTKALDMWYVDANLHLWLDPKSSQTFGRVINYNAPRLVLSEASEYSGLDGSAKTTASRRISCTGWLNSSFGTITTRAFQHFNYWNFNVFRGNGSIQVLNQTIMATYGSVAKTSSAVVKSQETRYTFPLYVYSETTNEVNGSYTSVSEVSLEFDETKLSDDGAAITGPGFALSKLKNMQNGHGEMKVKGNLVTSGAGSTKQVYRYEGTDGCYFQSVGSRNCTVLYDDVKTSCQFLAGSSSS